MTTINNFISEPERIALLEWANSLSLHIRNQPDLLLNRPENADRQPTTGIRESNFIFKTGTITPEKACCEKCVDGNVGSKEFFDIQNRILNTFNLQGHEPVGRQGKIIKHHADSETPSHIDNLTHLGPGYMRTTIMLQTADNGGELIVDGEIVPMKIGACYHWTTSVPHEVKLVTNGTRIVLIYGWKD